MKNKNDYNNGMKDAINQRSSSSSFKRISSIIDSPKRIRIDTEDFDTDKGPIVYKNLDRRKKQHRLIDLQNSIIRTSEGGGDIVDNYIKTKKFAPLANNIVEQRQNYFYQTKPSDFFCKFITFWDFLKILTAYPFVIVVATLNLGNNDWIKESLFSVYLMNLSIYMLPPFIVSYFLSQPNSITFQRFIIGAYVLLYLFPVIIVVSNKLKISRSTSEIDVSTFCFKPARRVQWTIANVFLLSGFFVDWIQQVFYVMPIGVITSEKATTLEQLPPYLSFDFYFWFAVVSVILCAFILILNAALRGHTLLMLKNNWILWLIYFNIGGAYFVSVVTILFMGLSCQKTIVDGVETDTLVQSNDIECWSGRILDLEMNHRKMAFLSLLCLAFFLIQMTLLPSGTFKETMTDTALDIVFVPVYLQAHMILKAVFSGFYVMFYNSNFTRVFVLTAINLFQFVLNQVMAPCSIHFINRFRSMTFVTGMFAGVQSLNFIGNGYVDYSDKNIFISSLVSMIVLFSVGTLIYHFQISTSSELVIARAFLDLEWQLSRQHGSVNPRVLEPLIALSLSENLKELQVVARNIQQLVWLISYPNIRVQFQAAWALSNISSWNDEFRANVHKAKGIEVLFKHYDRVHSFVRLEVLAAIVNLTKSDHLCEYMQEKHSIIEFLLLVVRDNSSRLSHFAAIGITNIARNPKLRQIIIRKDGLPIMIGCFANTDRGHRIAGCRALANLSMDLHADVEKDLSNPYLLRILTKQVIRNEKDAFLPAAILLHNLLCRPSLRPSLLAVRGYKAVEVVCRSNYPQLRYLGEDMYAMLKAELRTLKDQGSMVVTDHESLSNIVTLGATVTWSTWGSRLDTLFNLVKTRLPPILHTNVCVNNDATVELDLASHFDAGLVFSIQKKEIKILIMQKPMHGVLSHVSAERTVVYTPNVGYVGPDTFLYTLRLGGVHSDPIVVPLDVLPSKGVLLRTPKGYPSDVDRSKGEPRHNDEPDLEAGGMATPTYNGKKSNQPSPVSPVISSPVSPLLPEHDNQFEVHFGNESSNIDSSMRGIKGLQGLHRFRSNRLQENLQQKSFEMSSIHPNDQNNDTPKRKKKGIRGLLRTISQVTRGSTNDGPNRSHMQTKVQAPTSAPQMNNPMTIGTSGNTVGTSDYSVPTQTIVESEANQDMNSPLPAPPTSAMYSNLKTYKKNNKNRRRDR